MEGVINLYSETISQSLTCFGMLVFLLQNFGEASVTPGSTRTAATPTTINPFNVTVEPLNCYSCQTENPNDECYRMNNTDLIPTQVCPPTHKFCKVSHFAGNLTFRYINRTCGEQCNMGCVQAAASGDYVFLEMCNYCCTDHLCNTRNTASIKCVLFEILLLCFIALLVKGR